MHVNYNNNGVMVVMYTSLLSDYLSHFLLPLSPKKQILTVLLPSPIKTTILKKLTLPLKLLRFLIYCNGVFFKALIEAICILFRSVDRKLKRKDNCRGSFSPKKALNLNFTIWCIFSSTFVVGIYHGLWRKVDETSHYL